jgi:membrane protein YqaA with SNARE-associated domain
MPEGAALLWLFASCFAAATFLPFPSEMAFAAYLHGHPDRLISGLIVATAGNTLGGLSTYALGRWLLRPPPAGRAFAWIQRYGVICLLLSWVPLFGDALCAAAGWLRLRADWVTAMLALGKGARYWVLAQAVT